MTGIIALNNFADIPQFICSSIEAASRARLARVSKLCLQYINPIIKNRIYNYIPAGLNPFVGTQARPNEITYSEDRLRPGYTPPPPPDAPAPPDGPPPPAPVEGQLPAEPPPPPPNSMIDSTQVLRNLLLPTGQP
jgi:phospholipid/cholesterol/gamma-HCH transport system substrate-binding protein